MTTNRQLLRASARPASILFAGSSHSRAKNCEAGFYSGAKSDSSTGGTRHSMEDASTYPHMRSPARLSSSTQPLDGLESHFARTVVFMFLAGVASVGFLTLVLL